VKPGLTLRVARPTDNLASIAAMYVQGLGFVVLAEFVDHDGFDGVILGHAEDRFHLEFTTRVGYEVGNAPTEDHLLVFYIPDRAEWEASCAGMMNAGFRDVASYNPYWDVRGRTFEDVDGYRVVLQNAAWVPELPVGPGRDGDR
jgi:prolyl oligopeptidase